VAVEVGESVGVGVFVGMGVNVCVCVSVGVGEGLKVGVSVTVGEGLRTAITSPPIRTPTRMPSRNKPGRPMIRIQRRMAIIFA
jgi:hypothetical protein